MRTLSQNGKALKKPGRSGTRDTRVRVVSAEKQHAQLEYRKHALMSRVEGELGLLNPKHAAELERVNTRLIRHL